MFPRFGRLNFLSLKIGFLCKALTKESHYFLRVVGF